LQIFLNNHNAKTGNKPDANAWEDEEDRIVFLLEPLANVLREPGFMRGLSFYGPLAFIGLSQVRESAVFSGFPLVERLKEAKERTCGVWVLNTETGETLGFCKFL